MLDFQKARAIQEETRERLIIDRDEAKDIGLICALDVSYRSRRAFSCGVIYDAKRKIVIEAIVVESEVKAPYVPGFFFLREISPLLSVIRLLKTWPDLALVNGHGYSHPRRAGIASYFGVLTGIPTIGVAKRILIGEEVCDSGGNICKIIDGGEVIGMAVKSEREKWYVSAGHKITLNTSVEIVRTILNSHGGSLYPMVLSDKIGKRCKAVAERA